MALWICTSCGGTEQLNIYPDGCSLCGGSMETQDGRSTCAAEQGDAAAIIRRWHRGQHLTGHQRQVIDELRQANAMALATAAFANAAA